MFFDEATGDLQLDENQPLNNYIRLSSGERLLKELSSSINGGKGKNSCVYRAIDADDQSEVIVKFCKFHKDVIEPESVKRRLRFLREIRALELANERKLGPFLLTMYESGEHKVGKQTFSYYVMEQAQSDLTEFLQNYELLVQQKLNLCENLLRDLKALHSIGIYHRDIKPDNIFFCGAQWKLGDLGFIAHRGEDADIVDEPRDRIGPTGLMSPEAVNKAFCAVSCEHLHDRQIDDLSDIYNLAGVFWYILEGTLPAGQITREDLSVNSGSLFSDIVFPMLQYKKSRRPPIRLIEEAFLRILPEFAS